MKIAIIGENYYPTVGGIQEHMYNQAKWLRKMGHDAHIITGMPTVKVWIGPQDSPWVHRLGKAVRYGVMGTVTNFTLGPRVAANLKRLFRNENFDLIHVHNPCDFGLPLLAYQLYEKKIVATLHSAFKHTPGRTFLAPYYRGIFKRTDKIIAVSELAAASMLRYGDFSYDIIANGVNVQMFSQGRKCDEYNDGRKNILYLGRFEKRNGLDKLLAALPSIVNKYPQCRLLVAGAARNGSTAAYERLVPGHCRKNVTFLGAVADHIRPDLYASADLFVLPARFGGSFSIMVLEALAAGIPVVSTPFVDEKYRGAHWHTVQLTRDYTPAAIAATINRVLALDNGDIINEGKNIVKRYDWKNVTKQLLSSYDRLLSCKDGPTVSA